MMEKEAERKTTLKFRKLQCKLWEIEPLGVVNVYANRKHVCCPENVIHLPFVR